VDEAGFNSLRLSQAGVFTRSQAIKHGLASHSATRMIQDQTWLRVAGRAFVPNNHPIGPEQMAWAAALSMAGATIFGASALALWRPDAPLTPPYAVQVVVPKSRQPQARISPKKIAVPADERALWQGIPVQTPQAALVDSLATLDEPQADRIFGWAVPRSLVAAKDFEALVERRKGAPNAARLRKYAALLRQGAASNLEVLFHLLMKEHNITGWEANAPVTDGGLTVAVADALFKDAALALEIDGWSAHRSKDAFQRDRTRQNALVQAGYKVLRFTYDDITKRPYYCVGEIKRALIASD
jgi:very-short-patch-repair endonuclease